MAVLSKEFALDPAILGKGSAAHIAVSGATNASTLGAIAANTPFPAAVDLGRIALDVETGDGVEFAAGDASVSFKSGATFESGVGIFDTAAAALNSLGLERENAVDLQVPATSGSRWALMRWRYGLKGAVSGGHPLGAIGAATFGVDASRDATYAVLQRFDATTGARDVLASVVGSWRLPRHVDLAGGDLNLKPLTWIVAEADGSLALNVAARLGYDVSFTHESSLLGLTRDLGAKLDANLKATVGLTVAGRYLIVIGRENAGAASRVVRLRLFKQSRRGLGFGLNVSAGVKGLTPLPKKFDDFVRSVFGVHGPQVLRDLHVIETWADPSRDLAETAARLLTQTGLDLLQRATGLDPVASFHQARKIVVDAIQRWDGLPDRLSAMLWEALSGRTPDAALQGLRKVLMALSGPDLEKRRDALVSALQQAPVSESPVARWLQAIAEHGLLALTNDLDRVATLARDTLSVLESDVIRRLGQFITTKLDLEPLRRAVADDDFKALDEWLVKRLADLLNKSSLNLDELKQVQQAITAVDAKARALYEQGVKALTKRYSADLASTYERTRATTALLDLSFDLTSPPALAAFRTVSRGGDFADLLVNQIDGVHLHEAALTHDLERQAHVEVRLPFVTAESTRVTESLAKLSIEEHAGRVLVYEFDATDTVTSANRARSELSVLGTLKVATGAGAAALPSHGTIGYEARRVQRGMRPEELEARTRSFVEAYLAPLFPDGESSIRAFYSEMTGAIVATGAGNEGRLGDVALSTELSYPAEVLEGWLLPRDEEAVRRDSMHLSRAVQASIRRLLARTYFEDPDHLQVVEPVAALLVWASLPISTSLDARATPIRFNTDRDVFWDYVTLEDRRAVARDSHTVATLRKRLADAQLRLREADGRNANQFGPDQAGRFVQLALDQGGDLYFTTLLNAEALMIRGAVRALRTIADAVRESRTAPAAAVRNLSEFAATLVETFSGHLQFVYSDEAMRTLGPMMLAEASAAIHPAFHTAAPGAALRLYVLKRGHGFALDTFLKGELPSADNVAIAETLVRG